MTSASPPPQLPTGLDPMMDVKALAEFLRVPVSTIYDWRTNRKGPPGYRVGKHVVFQASEVKAWLEEQRDTFSSNHR
ncbi:helix-turn-helix domain-containing protein [Gryllotalpicola reticulitermitis]|uniref:Helix-turn-helix domain-containing protein n=1 Tax=Gryllotalpicola reticulitermitis TaxID=1184153 RepID=A0ABV8QC50_9MICO